MAVERVGMVIAIWVVCAVLLVVVIALAIYLFCHLRRRQRHVCDVDEEEECRVSRHDRYLEDRPDARGAAQLRIYSDPDEDPDRPYHGYRRGGVQNLLVSPAPGAYQADALLVQLMPFHATGSGGRVDVLVNVVRQDANVPDPRYTSSAFTVLGNTYDQPGFFHDDFLLYTAPLFFTQPGRYVVQGYTVNTHTKFVGPVHQFVYVLSADGTGRTAGDLPTSGGARRIDVTVDQQAGALVPFGASPAPTTSVDHHSAAAGVVPYSTTSSGALTSAVAPPPPRIEPSEGTVTTTTRIVISPHPQSPGGEHIRYSVDGSYPNLVYTGPFTLSLPPPSLLPERRLPVVVKAVSVSANAVPDVGGSAVSRNAPSSVLASPVATATLTVRPSGYSYYDPALPAPSLRVRTQGAKLYFDESNNPSRSCTCYQVLYLQDARRHKVRFNRKKCEVYRGQAIPLTDTVAMVYAWTVDELALQDDHDDEEGGMDEGYDGHHRASAQSAEPFTIFSPTSPHNVAGGRPGHNSSRSGPSGPVPRIRSVATIYNCSRASTEHGQVSRKRVPPGASLLPPPVLCISCDEVEVEFDEPPAHSLIAYTLTNKEPALLDVSPPACAVPIPTPGSTARRQLTHARSTPTPAPAGRSGARGNDHSEVVEGDADGHDTFIYETGKPIRVTQLESHGVYLTARLFAPVYESAGGEVVGDCGAQGGTASAGGAHLGYRYGDAFHRGFFFQAGP